MKMRSCISVLQLNARIPVSADIAFLYEKPNLTVRMGVSYLLVFFLRKKEKQRGYIIHHVQCPCINETGRNHRIYDFLVWTSLACRTKCVRFETAHCMSCVLSFRWIVILSLTIVPHARRSGMVREDHGIDVRLPSAYVSRGQHKHTQNKNHE